MVQRAVVALHQQVQLREAQFRVASDNGIAGKRRHRDGVVLAYRRHSKPGNDQAGRSAEKQQVRVSRMAAHRARQETPFDEPAAVLGAEPEGRRRAEPRRLERRARILLKLRRPPVEQLGARHPGKQHFRRSQFEGECDGGAPAWRAARRAGSDPAAGLPRESAEPLLVLPRGQLLNGDRVLAGEITIEQAWNRRLRRREGRGESERRSRDHQSPPPSV